MWADRARAVAVGLATRAFVSLALVLVCGMILVGAVGFVMLGHLVLIKRGGSTLLARIVAGAILAVLLWGIPDKDYKE